MMYSIKLKDAREEKGISQKDISKIINISNSGYERYENEHDIFPLKHLIEICNYLEVSLDYLFSFNNKNNFSKPYKIDTIKIGKQIKNFRKEHKLTQVKLATILNIGNGTLADYERGRYLISTHALYSICKKYKISADYLLGKINEPKYLD